MEVFDERPVARFTVPAAHGDQRQLSLECDQLLRQLVLAELLEGIDTPLTLPVVAHASGLDERGEPCLGERPEPGRRDPEPPEELLLDEPVLTQLERPNRRGRVEIARRLDGDVLELVGDHVRPGGEAFECDPVVEVACDQLSDGPRRSVRGRIEEPEPQPERDPRGSEHPAQLAAADAGDERHSGRVTPPGRARREPSASGLPGTRPAEHGFRRRFEPESPRRAAPR